jgi:ABC-type transporter Mla MlaB component
MQGRGHHTTVVLLCEGIPVIEWRLSQRSRADLEEVDGLARLQLAARRAGCSIVLQDPDPELQELLLLSGLADVLPTSRTELLPVDMDGQTEGREQGGVQEVGDH